MSMYIDGIIIAELEEFAPLAITKLLEGLQDIDGQAEAVASAIFKRWLSEPVLDDDGGDASEAAEAAEGRAQEVYNQLRLLEQGAINLLAVWLFQFFELQKRDYVGLARKRRERCVEFESLGQWPAVDELKALAETIKHGEDRDGAFRRRRPDLFQDPILKKLGHAELVPKRVRMPLAGDGPYVTVDMLHSYIKVLYALWGEVKSEHERLNCQAP